MATMDWLKKNLGENTRGVLNKGFLAMDVANLVTSENKLKAIKDLIKDLIFIGPIMSGIFISAFLGMNKAVKTLVQETGSLDAALRKLAQIQNLQRVFDPLVGGAQAAKLKVAELVNFAASKNIKLGDAAEAARSLQIMTKGGFAGAQALDIVNDAAKSTGVSVVALADATGEFYDTLSSGDSIEGAANKLRQMGAISGTAADELIRLQKNGGTAEQVFMSLTDTLEEFSGGAEKAKDTVEGVNEAFEVAKKNLQVKFGSPFVASDIENTKNWIEVMDSLGPSLARVAQFFQILGGGFETLKSKAIAAVASTGLLGPVLEHTTYALAALITGIAAYSTGSLVAWLAGSASMTASTTIFGSTLLGTLGTVGATAVNIVAAASAFGVFGAGVAAAAIIVNKWVDSVEQAAAAIQDLQKSQAAAADAIAKQIDGAKTLADLHNALTAALDAETAAQVALNEARKGGDPAKIAAQESNLLLARKNVRRGLGRGPADVAGSTEAKAETADIAKRIREKEERDLAIEMEAASPRHKAALLEGRSQELTRRAEAGKLSRGVAIDTAKKSFEAGAEVDVAERRVKLAKTNLEGAKAMVAQGGAAQGAPDMGEEYESEAEAAGNLETAILDLAAAKKKLQEVGSKAPEGTVTALEYQKRQVEAGNAPDKGAQIDKLDAKIAEAKRLEETVAEHEEGAGAAKGQSDAITRQRKLDEARIATEKEIDEIKERGFLRTDKELAAKLKLLDAEEAHEKARPGGANEARLREIQGQRTAALKAQRIEREEIAVTKMGAELDQARLDILQGGTARVGDQRPGLKRGGIFEGTAAEAHGMGPKGMVVKSIEALDDFNVFVEKFKELKGQGFEPDEAEKRAKAFADSSVALSAKGTAVDAVSTTVADSLTKIGGGGGVYAPSGDPLLTAAQRQIDLHEAELEYLKTIAEAGKSTGVL